MQSPPVRNAPKRILLIDDCPEVLLALELGLEFAGFEVTAAPNLHDAWSFLVPGSFDLVVCDFLLQETNGMEFKRELNDLRLSLPPFIFCSGIAKEVLASRYPEEMENFLEKPFSITELVGRIEECLSCGGSPETRRPDSRFTLESSRTVHLLSDFS